MIDIALAQLLTQASGLQAARVVPAITMQPLTGDSLPRVAYTVISNPRQYTDSGVMGHRRATVQLDVFGTLPTQAHGVMFKITARADDADQAKRGLDGYAGTVDQTAIRRISFGDDHDEAGGLIPGQNQAIARCVVEMYVDYRELLTQPNFIT